MITAAKDEKIKVKKKNPVGESLLLLSKKVGVERVKEWRSTELAKGLTYYFLL
jgi:hypothetical protein